MKKLIMLFATVIAFQIGYSQPTCTPNSPSGSPGLTPSPDNVPCIIRGQYYEETIYFENFSSFSANIGGIPITVDVNFAKIDSVTNLPCGLSWVANKLNFSPGETGCITVYGTSTENIGQYVLNIFMTFELDFAGLATQQVSGSIPSLVSQAAGLGVTIPIGDIDYVSRVIDSGMSCPARNINSTDMASGANCPCNAPPAPVISGPANVITMQTETYSVTPQAGYTYAWNVQGGTITSGQGTESITVEWGPINSSASVMLTWTEPGGCPSDATIAVTVNCNPPAAPTITGSTTPSTTQFETYSAPQMTGLSYQWSVTGGNIIAGQGTNSITVSWTTTGSQSVMLTWTDNATSCSSDATLPVTVSSTPCTPPAPPVITGSSTVAEQQQGVVYQAPSKSGFTYSWSVAGGTIASGSGTNSITVNWGGVGNGNVSLTWDSAGCSSNASFPVSIVACTPPAAPVINGPATVAEQQQDVVYSVPQKSGFTYTWTVSGGSIASGDGTHSITVDWGGMGTGTVMLEWDSAGCASNASLTVDITCAATSAPTITGATSATAEKPETYSAPNEAGYTYTWTVSSGGTIDDGQGTNSVTVTWTSDGSLTLVWMDSSGCSATAKINVNVTTGIGRLSAQQNKLLIYPNPASTELFIVTKEQPIEIVITNILGETILYRKLNTSGKVDVSQLTPGVYFVYDRLHTGVARFVKE